MLTIAWDVDDVLNDLMRTWLEEWWKPQHLDCAVTYQDLTTNPPHQLLNIEPDEYLQSLDEFRCSGNYEQMRPNSKILEWFQKQGCSFRHIALTAVPRVAAHISAAWVISHFGDWIRTFHFVPGARTGDTSTAYESTKGGYLKWLNRVDIFIDDNARNIYDVESVRIRCFPVLRPWNSGGTKINEILKSISL